MQLGKPCEIAVLDGHPTMESICSFALSSDETILTAGYCDYNNMAWEAEKDFEPIGRVLGLESWSCGSHCPSLPNNIVFLPGTHILASGTDNPGIPFRDVDTGKLVVVINAARQLKNGAMVVYDVADIAFTPDSEILVIAAGREIQMRDPQSGEFFHYIEMPSGKYVTDISVAQSGTLWAIGYSDGTVELFGIPG